MQVPFSDERRLVHTDQFIHPRPESVGDQLVEQLRKTMHEADRSVVTHLLRIRALRDESDQCSV